MTILKEIRIFSPLKLKTISFVFIRVWKHSEAQTGNEFKFFPKIMLKQELELKRYSIVFTRTWKVKSSDSVYVFWSL